MKLSLSARQRLTLSLCAMAYAIIYTGRQNLSIASPLMQADGITDSVGIGVMSSAFFFVYAIGRLLNGYIGDRVNARVMLMVGMGAAGLSNLLAGFMPPLPALIVLWGVNGFFQSMLWGPALKTVVTAYEGSPRKGRALMTMSTGVGLGSFIAVVIATLAANGGARAVFWIPAALILFFGALLIFLPADGLRQSDDAKTDLFAQLRVITRDPKLWRLLFPAAAHGVVKDNLILWVPELFMTQYGLDLKNAAYFVFIMPLANFIGRLTFPAAFRLFRENQGVTVAVSFGLCVAALAPFLIATPPALVSALLLALVAVATSWINATFLSIYPADYAREGCVSTVAGVMDAATYTGSAIGSAVFGVMIAATGYTGMIAVWIGLCVLSIPLMLWRRKG